MTTFFLSKSKRDNRLILDVKPHGEILGTYEGEDEYREVILFGGRVEKRLVKSAWQDARSKVKDDNYLRIENRGWFFSLADAMAKNSPTDDSLPEDAQSSFALRHIDREAA